MMQLLFNPRYSGIKKITSAVSGLGRERMKHSPRNRFYKKPLAASITAALLTLSVNNAQAKIFELGDFEISFDSTFSVGSSWRTEDRNWNDYVSKANNINNGFDLSHYNAAANATPINTTLWQGQGSYSNNTDNGNLNYDAGETFSKIVKGTHELDIRNDNVGLFVRGMYFYDFEMMDGDRAWNNPISGQQKDPCLDDVAKDQVCRDIRLLDAFIYGDFDLGEMPFSVRVGQQVISWGENTFIPHGISEINPIDVARLRAPGSELKEAFVPFGSVWASLGVTDTFNIEMFYQYTWEKSILPAPGSYFSTNDFAGDGGHLNNISLGFSGNPDIDLSTMLAGLNQIGDMLRSGDADLQAAAGAMYMAYPTKITLRAPGGQAEVKPDDGGQYGLRLSWYLPELNETEVSLYYINYHSRRPLFSGATANFEQATLGADLGYIAGNEMTVNNVYDELGAFSQLKLFYPEDIKMYAFSFNTSVGTMAVAGEMSYRQDEPIQIDDVELLFAAMPQQLANAGISPELEGISQMRVFQPGETADGFLLSDTLQAQFTLTQLWGPTIGASQFVTLVEFGGIDIQDMPEQDVLRMSAPGTARNGGIAGKEGMQKGVQNGVETNRFADDFAWGYRAVAKLDFNNVVMGINMSPRLVFSHDVKGITPDPLALFIEDRKSLSFGVKFDYQNRWAADFSYNSFFDGVGTSNLMEDRDYVSLSVSYSI
jgi:hypothetical protein